MKYASEGGSEVKKVVGVSRTRILECAAGKCNLEVQRDTQKRWNMIEQRQALRYQRSVWIELERPKATE